MTSTDERDSACPVCGGGGQWPGIGGLVRCVPCAGTGAVDPDGDLADPIRQNLRKRRKTLAEVTFSMKASRLDVQALAEVLLAVHEGDLVAQFTDDLEDQYAMRESVELALEAMQTTLGAAAPQVRADPPPRDS